MWRTARLNTGVTVISTLYINDLAFAYKRIFPELFADESYLFLTGKMLIMLRKW